MVGGREEIKYILYEISGVKVEKISVVSVCPGVEDVVSWYCKQVKVIVFVLLMKNVNRHSLSSNVTRIINWSHYINHASCRSTMLIIVLEILQFKS